MRFWRRSRTRSSEAATWSSPGLASSAFRTARRARVATPPPARRSRSPPPRFRSSALAPPSRRRSTKGLSRPSGHHSHVTTAEATAASFGDRLAERVVRRRSQLVLGLDPDPALLWPHALELVGGVDAASAPPAVRAARAVAAHCELVIDAVAEHCVAVKPQLACFERLGPAGWSALEQVIGRAREAGLLVIADAKRGDIDVTARAYAQAFLAETPSPFGSIPGVGADAMTVSPWLGSDSLEPFTSLAREAGA